MTLFQFTNGVTRDYPIDENGRISVSNGTGSIVHEGDEVCINIFSDSYTSYTLRRVDNSRRVKIDDTFLTGMKVGGSTLINCTWSPYRFLWRDGTYSILPLSSCVANLEEEKRIPKGKIRGELSLSAVQMRLPEFLANPMPGVYFVCEREIVQCAGARRPDIVTLNKRGRSPDGPIYDRDWDPILYRGVEYYLEE